MIQCHCIQGQRKQKVLIFYISHSQLGSLKFYLSKNFNSSEIPLKHISDFSGGSKKSEQFTHEGDLENMELTEEDLNDPELLVGTQFLSEFKLSFLKLIFL